MNYLDLKNKVAEADPPGKQLGHHKSISGKKTEEINMLKKKNRPRLRLMKL